MHQLISLLDRAQRALSLSDPQPQLARAFVLDATERLHRLLDEQDALLDRLAGDPQGGGYDPWGSAGPRPQPDVNGES